MMKNFKKIAISGVVILAFVFYALHEKSQSSDAINSVTGSTQQSTTSVPSESINPNANSSGGSTTGVSNSSGTYKDGSYTSAVTDAFYGNIQIKATISGGKISDVVFLQYPNDRDTSREINTAAMPVLRSEAIFSQNANVDIVSGATQTSEAFRQAMEDVLNKAS